MKISEIKKEEYFIAVFDFHVFSIIQAISSYYPTYRLVPI